VKLARSTWWTIIIVALVFFLWGLFVLGFLSEPSAIGRMRTALIGIGAASIILGVGGASVGLWMLFRRHN
jgi:hypothetical protein